MDENRSADRQAVPEAKLQTPAFPRAQRPPRDKRGLGQSGHRLKIVIDGRNVDIADVEQQSAAATSRRKSGSLIVEFSKTTYVDGFSSSMRVRGVACM